MNGGDRSFCPVCERTASEKTHPCRFAVACSCFRGKPCDGSGRVQTVTGDRPGVRTHVYVAEETETEKRAAHGDR